MSTLNASTDLEKRRNAIFQLSSIDNIDKSTIPCLIKASQDEDVLIREFAIKTIGKMDPHIEDVTNVLHTALRDPSIAVRRAAAASFSSMDPVPTVLLIPMTDALNEQDSLLCSFAKSMFVDIGLIGVNALMQACKNPDDVLRCNAVTLLGKIGNDAKLAIPTLEKLLQDENERVRSAARQSIAMIKNGYSQKNRS
jgi:HEAT repeat protein